MSSIQITLSHPLSAFPFFHCFCRVWNISESINAENLIKYWFFGWSSKTYIPKSLGWHSTISFSELWTHNTIFSNGLEPGGLACSLTEVFQSVTVAAAAARSLHSQRLVVMWFLASVSDGTVQTFCLLADSWPLQPAECNPSHWAAAGLQGHVLQPVGCCSPERPCAELPARLASAERPPSLGGRSSAHWRAGRQEYPPGTQLWNSEAWLRFRLPPDPAPFCSLLSFPYLSLYLSCPVLWFLLSVYLAAVWLSAPAGLLSSAWTFPRDHLLFSVRPCYWRSAHRAQLQRA